MISNNCKNKDEGHESCWSKYCECDCHKTMKDLYGVIVKQREVTDSEYFDMLETVPPIRQAANAFLVGEPVDHAIVRSESNSKVQARYDLYFTENNHYYYGGLTTVYGFDLFTV